MRDYINITLEVIASGIFLLFGIYFYKDNIYSSIGCIVLFMVYGLNTIDNIIFKKGGRK